MRKIRVLVVDDSTVIRRLLSDTLAEDPQIEIAGTAANGKIAIAKLTQVNPDIVTLDMEMPEMNGIETLVELRKTHPKLPVIMFSTLTQRGAEATFDALAKGASDYVTKPANVGSVSASLQNVRQQLVPKIKALCPWLSPSLVKVSSAKVNTTPRVRKPNIAVETRIDMIGIGVSTGGPNALAKILPKLPARFPMPIMIVQHMPPIFTKHLANRLNGMCNIGVVEASHGEIVQPGIAYIAPGDFHMSVRRQGVRLIIELDQAPPENSCRPAVDVLFRSLAQNYGPSLSATILTGMGQDGLRGCEIVRDAGGTIQVQDEATSVVWGMPGVVANAGLADKVIPLEEIATHLMQQASVKRVRPILEGTHP